MNNEEAWKVAAQLHACAIAWDPDVRLVGNVRAEDIARLCGYVLQHDDAAIKAEREACCAILANAEPNTRAEQAIARVDEVIHKVPPWLAGEIATWLEASADQLRELQALIRARGEDAPYVCPGCHAVGMTYTDHEQRMLDQDESIFRTQRPVQLPAWFALCMDISTRECAGGECDLDAPCFRHDHADQSARRLHRLRARRLA